MSDQDQLEREVEASLARLATRAVPDTARPPAPPWQQRRTVVDARRFGRATPWLIAAVLLVIAGLGVGASVAFDASAPDRGPVGTDLPTRTGTTIVPDGTLGTPTPSVTPPTSRSTPTFSRDSNGTGPDDDLGTFLLDIGSYGPITVGTTEATALADLGVTATDETTIGSCYRALTLPGSSVQGGRELVISLTTGGVYGLTAPPDAVDAAGHGVGTTLAALRATYPDGEVVHSEAGYLFVRLGSGDTGIGYVLSTDLGAAAEADTDTVIAVRVGTQEWAKGFELFCKSG